VGIEDLASGAMTYFRRTLPSAAGPSEVDTRR